MSRRLPTAVGVCVALALVASACGCTVLPVRPVNSARTVLHWNPRGSPPGSAAFERSMDELTGSRLAAGNEVRLLVNGGEAFPLMLEAIAAAKRSVSVETYIFRLDATGRRFHEALAAAAGRGVRVRLLYDHVGSEGLKARDFGALLAAGGEIRVFNPVAHWTMVRVNNRDHRKILVVDGETAFLGGLNYADEYDGDGVSTGWRDTHLRVSGPAARDAERIFAEGWLQGGVGVLGKDIPLVGVNSLKRAVDEPFLRLFAEESELPLPPVRGTAKVRLVASAPDRPASRILDMVLLAIASARERVWITNAYFIPPLILRRALVDAAGRGVDVRLLLPEKNDVPQIQTLSRRGYGVLLKSGVRIWEWSPSVLHAKTMVVDGQWATVGSANLDSRALFLNYEANAVVSDPAFARRVEEQFERDLGRARPVLIEEWRERPLKDRAREVMLAPVGGQF